MCHSVLGSSVTDASGSKHSKKNSQTDARLKQNRSALGDRELKLKLDSVISILSSMKNDFN